MTGCQNTVKNEMKQLILIICAVLATGLATTSCKKDKSVSCSCKEYDSSGNYQFTTTVYDNSSCSHAASVLGSQHSGRVSCSQI